MKTKFVFTIALSLLLAGAAKSQTTWFYTNKASIPQALLSGGARALGVAPLNGKFYTVGGLNQPSPKTTVLEYDPLSDTWTNKANMLSARYAPAAAALNGKLYAIGGTAGGSSIDILSSVEEYDPVTDTWTNRASSRAALCASATNTACVTSCAECASPVMRKATE